MLYAILYHFEDVVTSWTTQEDDAVDGASRHHVKVAERRQARSCCRAVPTTTATTLKKDKEAPLVIDGPFAETEQLLGYVIDGRSLDEVIDIARDFARANPGGSYEIRPISLYLPGSI